MLYFYLLFQAIFLLILIRQIVIVLITMWTFYMDDAPFRSTEKKVIEDLLKNVKFPKNGKVYDLGSGTGAAIFLIAKKNNANLVGIEKNKFLNFYANLRLKFSKNKEKISFQNTDIKNVDLKNASLIYSYLSGKAYQKFGDKFAKELKKNTPFIALRFKFDHPKFKLEKVIESKYPIYVYRKV